MKLLKPTKINGIYWPKGTEALWSDVYGVFVIHIFMFGTGAFIMAYSNKPAAVPALYAFGIFSIGMYLYNYINIFGLDEIKWMVINAALGGLSVYCQMDLLLSLFGRSVYNYPFYINAVPASYFVIYTFLLRQVALDLTESRDDKVMRRRVEFMFTIISVSVSAVSFWLSRI